MAYLEADLDDGATWFRTVAVKVHLSDFTTASRQASLPYPVRDIDEARRLVPGLMDRIWDERRTVRLIGVRLTGLSDPSGQRRLHEFADPIRH